MSEAIFWIAYFAAFGATLALALIIDRHFWSISFATAATSSAVLATFQTPRSGNVADPWFGVSLFISFGMAWFFAAAAIYVVKVIRA